MVKNKMTFKDFYNRIFSVAEIAESRQLQAVAAIVWFLYIFDLNAYSKSPLQYFNPQAIYELNCWSYWPQCHDYLHFAAFPFSYLYTEWMALLLGLMLVSLWAALKNKWCLAHFFLLIPVVWRVIFQFALVNYHTVNFDFFYLAPTFILLFARNKSQNLKYIWILCYLFAARVKLDDGWILGTYFTSIDLGFPFLPKALTPLATNITILFEIVASLGLLAHSNFKRQCSLYAWTGFHLISAITVGYLYPVRCLLFLWSLFGFGVVPKSKEYLGLKKSLAATFIFTAFCLTNFIPSMIPGDVNQTFAGIDYGFHMIDANHQCLNKVRHFSSNNQVLEEYSTGTRNPFGRCYPDEFLRNLKDNNCRSLSVGEHIEWKLWHSKNGGPFYETINTSDACHLEYQAFAKNSWIKEPSEGAPLVGYPEMNSIYKGGSPGKPVVFEKSQGEPFTYNFLRENYKYIRMFYLILWTMAFIYLVLKIIGLNLSSRKKKESEEL